MALLVFSIFTLFWLSMTDFYVLQFAYNRSQKMHDSVCEANEAL